MNVVRTLEVVCAVEALGNSFYDTENISIYVYIMSNQKIPEIFRSEGCRNVHCWCMAFQSTYNIHMTSNKNISGTLVPEHC